MQVEGTICRRLNAIGVVCHSAFRTWAQEPENWGTSTGEWPSGCSHSSSVTSSLESGWVFSLRGEQYFAPCFSSCRSFDLSLISILLICYSWPDQIAMLERDSKISVCCPQVLGIHGFYSLGTNWDRHKAALLWVSVWWLVAMRDSLMWKLSHVSWDRSRTEGKAVRLSLC